MRSLAVVLMVGLIACGGGSGGSGTEVVVRDSAGIAIVEHPAAAVDAVPLSQPGEPEISIGGLEADEDHDATFLTRGWLRDDGLLAYNNRAARFSRFDGQGALLSAYGGRGDGPDEFQAMVAMRLPGDSLLLVEMMRSSTRVLRPDLTTTPSVVFANEPSFRYNFFGAFPDGTLLATRGNEEQPTERSGPARRDVEHIVRKAPGASTWDTVAPSPGPLVYPMVFREGDQEYPGTNHVTFGTYPYRAAWGDGLVIVDNSDWTVAVHHPDGTLRQLIRLALPRRSVTESMRDSVFARDARQVEQFGAGVPPAMKEQFLTQSRAQMFADSVAPYDRILVTRDGMLWMRINEMPVDTSMGWFGFAQDGRLARRLHLPKRWNLLDTDGERMLIHRPDDDDIGYLEIRPLERITP